MSAHSRKISLYLAAFLSTSFVLLVMSDLPIATLVICGGGFAAVLCAIVIFSGDGSNSFHAPLAVIICGIFVFSTLSFLTSGFPAGQGFVASLKNSLQQSPIWYLVPSAIFAGLCLMCLTQDENQRFRVFSLLPDFGFGLGMMIVFYMALRAIPKHDLAVSAFWGDTIIHYLILLTFFLIASYILRCFLSIWQRRLEMHPNNLHLLPKEQSLRRFVRVLIGTLPLLGFLGTVLGITQALGGLPGLIGGDGDIGRDISLALGSGLANIAIAFETTMLGLITSLIASLTLSYGEKMERDLEVEGALLD